MSDLLRKLNSIGSKPEPSNKEEEDTMLAKDSTTSTGSAAAESTISADAVFKGSIQFKDTLRVDGQFEGEITSKGTLYIGKSGVVKANIKVKNIIVEGRVEGNVEAEEKIDLRATAVVLGDIKSHKLVISEGVVFVGHCDVNPNKEPLGASHNNSAEKRLEKIATK